MQLRKVSKYNCTLYLTSESTFLYKLFVLQLITNRAGRYTAEKCKRKYFCHTGINIEQKILYRQTEIL